MPENLRRNLMCRDFLLLETSPSAFPGRSITLWYFRSVFHGAFYNDNLPRLTIKGALGDFSVAATQAVTTGLPGEPCHSPAARKRPERARIRPAGSVLVGLFAGPRIEDPLARGADDEPVAPHQLVVELGLDVHVAAHAYAVLALDHGETFLAALDAVVL